DDNNHGSGGGNSDGSGGICDGDGTSDYYYYYDDDTSDDIDGEDYGGSCGNGEQKSFFHGMDTKEQEIFTLINNHRRQYGLPSLLPSDNLAYVAHTHAIDIIDNSPDVNGGNMHSWSNKGKWRPVKYTPDHQQAHLMWSKPSEISNYKFNGFEISFGYAQNVRKTMTISPTEAFNSWKNSPGHNGVMIQLGTFQNTPMKAMGVGVYKGYACVWFGQQIDTYPAPS
ncbi:unnamed protein product, partial [Rotaria sordida]